MEAELNAEKEEKPHHHHHQRHHHHDSIRNPDNLVFPETILVETLEPDKVSASHNFESESISSIEDIEKKLAQLEERERQKNQHKLNYRKSTFKHVIKKPSSKVYTPRISHPERDMFKFSNFCEA